jgi:hypothetical protein
MPWRDSAGKRWGGKQMHARETWHGHVLEVFPTFFFPNQSDISGRFQTNNNFVFPNRFDALQSQDARRAAEYHLAKAKAVAKAEAEPVAKAKAASWLNWFVKICVKNTVVLLFKPKFKAQFNIRDPSTNFFKDILWLFFQAESTASSTPSPSLVVPVQC